jgi:uncharacterized protein (TIGR00106 family)
MPGRLTSLPGVRYGFRVEQGSLGGADMKAIVELGVVPIGVGVSLSKYIAACERVLEETGLRHQLHSYGTNIEGEWDDVLAAVKRCHEVVHEMGAPRIFTVLKIGTRVDRDQSMNDKIKSVEDKIKGD